MQPKIPGEPVAGSDQSVLHVPRSDRHGGQDVGGHAHERFQDGESGPDPGVRAILRGSPAMMAPIEDGFELGQQLRF